MSIGNRRVFTREEDEMILECSQGGISFEKVIRTIRCGAETLYRRASELGLTLVRHPTNRYTSLRPPKSKRRILTDEDGEIIYQDAPHVGDDLLLQRLHLKHGDRRYEALTMKGET